MVAIAAGQWPAQPFDFLLNFYPNNHRDLATSTSSGSLFVTTYNNDGFARIAGYSVAGVIQWQRRYDSGNSNSGLFVNSSNEILVAARSGTAALQVQKVNSSTGAYIWQKNISMGSGCCPSTTTSARVCSDASGNVYTAIGIFSNCLYGINVSKFNSSGAIQWTKRLTNNILTSSAIAADSVGNVYIASSNATSTAKGVLIKLDTSGVFQWQQAIQVNGATAFNNVVVDSTGSNVYVVGTGSLAGTVYMVIAKYDSSGSRQWNRLLGSGGTPVASNETAITIDANSNVYVTGNYLFAYDFFMAKYNSSGTLQWQRKITNASFTTAGTFTSARMSATSPVFATSVFNSSTSETRVFVAKLPEDGSKTGTYSLSGFNWVYAASSLTSSDFTADSYFQADPTVATPSFTATDTTYVDSASSSTTATTSLA
jgi:hypothetical protein